MTSKRSLTGEVRSNEALTPEFHRLWIGLDLTGLSIDPGQFCMVKPSMGASHLLRRPLGVAAVQDDAIALLFDVRGRGTAELAACRPGQAIDVLLPLGRGFPLHPGEPTVLAAGGCGLAPLFLLATRLHAQGAPFRFTYGATCAGKLALISEILALCKRATFTTDDGSHGLKGRVAEHLPLPERPGHVYCCGPLPMMQAIARKAVAAGHTCWVSLEEFMACGIGVCNGCAVDLRPVDGQRRTARVCVDGPVFSAEELAWDLG